MPLVSPCQPSVNAAMMCGFFLAAIWGCTEPQEGAGANLVIEPPFIVGGEAATSKDYPATVALLYQGQVFCTGTLVDPTVVVTAAHCFGGSPAASGIRVVYGTEQPLKSAIAERRPVTKYLLHESYVPLSWGYGDDDGLGQANDLALVLLKEPIEGAITAPIPPLSKMGDYLYDGAMVTLVGYGVRNLTSNESNILYFANTPYQRDNGWEFLAGEPGQPDTCRYDSGGPVYGQDESGLWLIGVTSRAWKRSQATCGDGGIYSVPANYLEWIEDKAGITLEVPTVDEDSDSSTHTDAEEEEDSDQDELADRGGQGADGCSIAVVAGASAAFPSLLRVGITVAVDQ